MRRPRFFSSFLLVLLRVAVVLLTCVSCLVFASSMSSIQQPTKRQLKKQLSVQLLRKAHELKKQEDTAAAVKDWDTAAKAAKARERYEEVYDEKSEQKKKAAAEAAAKKAAAAAAAKKPKKASPKKKGGVKRKAAAPADDYGKPVITREYKDGKDTLKRHGWAIEISGGTTSAAGPTIRTYWVGEE